ncbi:MAG: prepilin-type N-terminal cleavage/methylation domain-containing protein [Phycisphaeraceae bacterium]|nr:prepilin-type N-terminal cleavage/methylation domain-containing protein [Phycisphaerales bacterium]MCB9861411.1 prepilin-type N-terminal cleavage/methylation domain-containing protein [Phycisphaeraceae bacterium]
MRRGLTLVELIVGIVVLSLVVSMVASSISSIGRARTIAVARADAFAQARVAVDRIAAAVVQIARDQDLQQARFLLTSEQNGANSADELMMLIRSMQPVRGEYGEPEGADREVQFRIGDAGGRPTYGKGAESILWERTDPALDQYLDGGGIAVAVASGIESLSIEAFDGESWMQTWDSDRDGLPWGVRINVTAHDTRHRVRAYGHRLIAIDRVATPWPPAEEEDEGEEGA